MQKPTLDEVKAVDITGKKKKVLSPEHRKKLSLSHMGNKNALGKCLGIAKHTVKHTEETKKKISLSRIGKNTGISHHNWKGGITPESKKMRQTPEANTIRYI